MRFDISECEKLNPPACVKKETEASRLRHMRSRGFPVRLQQLSISKRSLDYIPHHNLVARCWYAGPTDVQSIVWFPVNSRELRHAPQPQNTD